ncbi:MAG: hypothetical protein ACJZ1O_04455 [Candidatus Neomarinimicrobiota bacterium]|nr:MAG: hypothetical protein EVA23_06690 [bacterium]|tara:strand:- start:3 stop:473 length:471 start_codon:yes stop_codon:yes gene_type:complete
MPESNIQDQIPVPELSENQKYINEKVASLLDQIGDEYGESLTQQLVQRLDATVTDFHEEVTNMLSELKEKTVSRQQKLRDAWDHRFDNQPQQTAADVAPDSAPQESAADSSGGDSSEWEKRLETMESGKKLEGSEKQSSDTGKKKKKKGLFGRKKK